MDVLIASGGIFFWELYWNIVGGWSLVTQIVLQNILNMDLRSAMALDNSAVIWSNIGMLLFMFRKYKLHYWFIIYIVFQSIGSVVWAQILVHIDPVLLKIIFIIAVILLVIKNLFVKDKEHNEKWFEVNAKNLIWISLAATFIGMYNWAFVIWDWIVAILILTSLFAMKYQNAIYLLVVSMFISQPVAAYNYYVNDLLNLQFLFPMLLSAISAGLISAFILGKIHSTKLKKILKYLSVFLVIYLVYSIV